MKNIHYFFIIFIVFLVLINKSFSQNQEPIKLGGTCQTLTEDSICYQYLNYTKYYLPPNSTFQSVNKTASDYLGLLQLTNTQCSSNATYIFCIQQFPKCNVIEDPIDINRTYSFPSLPCNDVCLKAEGPCKTYIDIYFKSLSCTSNYTNGESLFPKSNTNYTLDDGNTISIECINVDELIYKNSTTEINCPSPLLNAKDYVIVGKDLYYYVTDNCIIDCPFDIYPKDKMDRLNDANWTLTIISFIVSNFMIITFGLLPNKISHRMESILSFAIGAWFLCLSLFIQTTSNDFNCSLYDRGRFKSQSDHNCLITGLFFQLGALVCCFWFPMISYDFYLTSKMQKLKHFRRYRIVLWSILIILTAIPAFAGKYGSSIGTGCWITGENGSAWQYVCFYIPSWISMGLITLFSILSVINITKMYLKVPNKRILFFNVKIVFTNIILLFNMIFASSLKFYFDDRINDFFDSVYEWAYCISTTNSVDKSNCVLNAPGYDIKALNVVAIALLGITLFIGLGIDPIVIKIWSESKKLTWCLKKFGLDKYFYNSNQSISTSNNISNKKNQISNKKITLSKIESSQSNEENQSNNAMDENKL